MEPPVAEAWPRCNDGAAVFRYPILSPTEAGTARTPPPVAPRWPTLRRLAPCHNQRRHPVRRARPKLKCPSGRRARGPLPITLINVDLKIAGQAMLTRRELGLPTLS